MILEILIATMSPRLDEVVAMLLPPDGQIKYLVSCQYESDVPAVPVELQSRADVRIVFLKGCGLSRNRNNALRYAEGDVLLISDDDCRYTIDSLHSILQIYNKMPNVDIALLEVEGMSKYYPSETIKFTTKDFKSAYCPASVEISIRHSSISAITFNELFGLGSDYLSAGEEQVFLYDALKHGLSIWFFPQTIGFTRPGTTGERFLQDFKVQRSKGATFAYIFGKYNARLMCIKEALYHFVFNHTNPIHLFRNMNDGIRYITHLKA